MHEDQRTLKPVNAHPVKDEPRIRSRIEEARRLARLDELGIARYVSLIKLRREMAGTEGIPAYQILSNRSLIAMAETPPRSLQELAELPGVGRLRVAAYGIRLLEGLGRSVA